MTSTGDFEKHLYSISREEWEQLFSLIPEIEGKEKFGTVQGGEFLDEKTISAQWIEPADCVYRFVNTVSAMGIVPVFDWTGWKEGQSMMADLGKAIGDIDLITACKLFTVCIRTDRFSPGYLVSQFENGNILLLLKRIESLVDDPDLKKVTKT